MNETNTTNVFILVKSGISALKSKDMILLPPVKKNAIVNPNRITAGIRIPIMKPSFEILAVNLVPLNCENVNAQKIINTPKNLTTGLLFNGSQLNT
ncbi:hypothetical protein SDC9_153641 [bioreactor metagenome]|uniref:Uncharacterized protein n=1 Tax=bioreactor metagenome TaxID=1076179 RepID=A0A645EWI6_9ZZZZ